MKKTLLMAILVLLSALVTQAATKYDINVAGVEVTSDNMNNIKGGDIKSGTVTFSPSTKTLTMTNVTITRTGSGDYAIHNRSYKGLIVKFVGTCNLTTKARVIRFQSGSNWSQTETPDADECQLVATSGATVNMTSTGDGAIYVRDFTCVWIKGPGTFNITGNKDGAIAGHGQWNSNVGDLATVDAVKFSNVTATVKGSQGSLLGLAAYFFAGSNVTFKATGSSSYPIARELYQLTKFFGNTAILTPCDAVYSGDSQSFVLNGTKVYARDIYISDNYALLLNTANFPDANFRSAMRARYPKEYLTQSELQNLTSLGVSGMSISNLTGVTKLTYLEILNCSSNSLSSLPTLPTGLTYLDCDANRLTSLPVLPSGLQRLFCSKNQITSLPAMPSSIEAMYAYDNMLSGTLSIINKPSLKALNVKNNTALTVLNCYNNALTALDVSGCSAITKIDCSNNQLTSLGTLPTNVQILHCAQNQLTSLPTLPSTLKTLYCYQNQLTSLPSMPSGIQEIYAYDNKLAGTLTISGKSSLTKLDVKNNTALTALDCGNGGALTSLDVSGCTEMKTLYCYYNKLTSLGTLPTNLQILNCNNNQLTSLPTLPASIQEVYARFNNLSGTLSITGKPSLKLLNVDNNPALTTLNCYNNALTLLNVNGCSSLSDLQCYRNELTSLNVQGMSSLQKINTFSNNLTSLNVSGCKSLNYLNIRANQIKESAMSSLIGSMRTIPSSDEFGTFYVYGENYSSDKPEGNEITAAQAKQAKDKRWLPRHKVGNDWVDVPDGSGMRGDVNGDGKVDVEDVNAVINIILKQKTAADYKGNADVKSDGKIDVEDVNAIINIILKLV